MPVRATRGTMRYTIGLVTVKTTRTAKGGASETEQVVNVRAAIDEVRGEEKARAQQLQALGDYRIKINYRTGVHEGQRVQGLGASSGPLGTKAARIVSVRGSRADGFLLLHASTDIG